MARINSAPEADVADATLPLEEKNGSGTDANSHLSSPRILVRVDGGRTITIEQTTILMARD